ncbi:MAG: OmpA family protein [Mycobacterium sp.]
MSADSRFHRRRFYRRPPGIGWVVALVTVPLLLALIGWAASNGSRETVGFATPSVDAGASPTTVSSSTLPPAAPGARFGAMSIVRSGNGFTLTGELPDASLKASLAESLQQAMPGAKIVDQLTVKPGVRGPEFAGLGGLFGAALDIPGFSAKFDGDTVTLTGTASSLVAKASAESAATATWPNVTVANDIQVVTGSAAPAAPPPAPAGVCATLQADVDGLLKSPITFDTNGFSLTPDSGRLVGQVADRIKACPGTKITVVGYTDDSGSAGVNVPLSASRAKSVADALISDGVAASVVTSRGAGSANPAAGNDTPAGRAKNRRVEITVG